MHQILTWIYFGIDHVYHSFWINYWVVNAYLSVPVSLSPTVVRLEVFSSAKLFYFSVIIKWLSLGWLQLSFLSICCFKIFTGNTPSRWFCPLWSLNLETQEFTSTTFLDGFSESLTTGIWHWLRQSSDASEWVVRVLTVNREGTVGCPCSAFTEELNIPANILELMVPEDGSLLFRGQVFHSMKRTACLQGK